MKIHEGPAVKIMKIYEGPMKIYEGPPVKIYEGSLEIYEGPNQLEKMKATKNLIILT